VEKFKLKKLKTALGINVIKILETTEDLFHRREV